jgi:hypothetical protein
VVHVPAQDEPGSQALAEGLEPVAEEMLADLVSEGVISEPNVSVVIALYPGSDEPVVTKIGEHTRYSELVADYLTEAKVDGEVMEYRVIGEDDGGHRSLSGIITGDDYGKRLVVERWDAAAKAPEMVNCDDCGRDSCNLQQRMGTDHTGCGRNGWAAKAEESAT